ncbi:hypothetical protein HCB27_04260 [Listeria booriae]|uniref:Bacterial Ig domain-containing protein n=1 Tax=Listeria booriae TaxID=1552123 RepID=A0A7X0Z4F3_9LIST|nr:Ig-like domain-containing protein [Listeria booriae]MBC2175814.1 hypothetical protein [Listeria booriae]MBC2370681.1 hypothetical protein [Listeria booriae]
MTKTNKVVKVAIAGAIALSTLVSVGTSASAAGYYYDFFSSPTYSSGYSTSVAAPSLYPVTTNDTFIEGSGMMGATVNVKVGQTNYSAVVYSNGYFRISIPKQSKDTLVSATQTLRGVTSRTATQLVAGVAVKPTLFNASINSTYTVISGTGTPLTTAKVQANGETYTSTVDADGKFSVTIPALTIGQYAQAHLVAANGEQSATFYFYGPDNNRVVK